MTAFWSAMQTQTARRLLPALGVTLAIALAALIPSAAHASGCTDSWTNTAGGSWFTGANWSKGTAPGAEDEVCITAEGAYQILMDQTSTTGTVSVKSLTIGAAAGAGHQELVVRSTCSLHAVFSTTEGTTLGTRGELEMTNGDGCSNNVTIGGPITDGGRIITRQQNGGQRNLTGSLTISSGGTLTTGANTSFTGATLTNEGTIKTEEKQVTVSNKASLTNGSGGKIEATGSGALLMEPETTFVEGAGTTSGTKPVIVRDAALKYEPSGGESTIAIRGTSATLSGTSSAKQSLSIESTCGEHAVATAASGFANGGSITMTNGDGCSNNATIAITSPNALANSGTITSEPLHGGQRNITGNLTNTGTVNIKATTSFNGTSALLKNEGALNLEAGGGFVVTNKASVTNASGGKIATPSLIPLLAEPETSFTEGAGTISGPAVILRDAALTYTGSGSGTIVVNGSSSTLNGGPAAGQSIEIESTCTEHAKLTAASSFTNAGTISLTNGDACSNNASLVSEGTITNTGKIVTTGFGGQRTIAGNLTNKEGLLIDFPALYDGESTVLKNEGSIGVVGANTLQVSNKAAIINGAGGDIGALSTGALLMEPGTSFTEAAGKTEGPEPVIVRDAALKYEGAGESHIATRGEGSTLSGGPSAGQSLSIESTCSEHAKTTAAASLTNGGSITLTNADGCSNNATLVITSPATLTNNGTITSEPAHGGGRTIQGSLTNKGTLAVNAGIAYNLSGATLRNEGAINLATEKTLSVSGPATFVNEAGTITATGSGNVVESGGTFDQGGGKTSGPKGSFPVVVDDATLDYTGKGSPSTIALRGTSTLVGPVNSKQTLSIQSTCPEHANATSSAPLVNSGTIVLTNGDSCGNNAALHLGGGTLENKGTLKAEEPHGGSRSLEGSLKNEKTVFVGNGASLGLGGSYTQTSKGSLSAGVGPSGVHGLLSVTGSATLAGALSVAPAKKFKGTLGNSFAILTAASRSGTFSDVDSATIGASGLYYKPIYSPTGVTLVVTQATLARAPVEGAPGTNVKLTGTGWPGEDMVKLVFTDSAAAKTTLPSVVTNSAGEFETEVTVPAGAALGAGKFTATSTIVGFSLTTAFNVT